MCTPVVLDASAFDVVKEESPSSAGVQLRAWIDDGHGRVNYSTYDEVGRQLRHDKEVFRLVRSYRQSGLAELIDEALMRREMSRLDEVKTRSGENDKQVLALAAASRAQVMVVHDVDLRRDFEDRRLLPTERGLRRKAYPIGHPPARRNDFLHRRRCPRRLVRSDATDRSSL